VITKATVRTRIICSFYLIGTREMQAITLDILTLTAAWILSLKPPFQRTDLSPSSGLWCQTTYNITLIERNFNSYFFCCASQTTFVGYFS